MNAPIEEPRSHGFVTGLMAGTLVGAGLMMWLAPRMAAEVRQRMSDSARKLAKRASDEYERAGTRASETLDDLTRKGQAVRDEVADVVARGAHKVEKYAVAAKSERVDDAAHTATDRKTSTSHSG